MPLVRLLPSDRHGPVSNVLRYAKEFISHSGLPAEDQYIAYVRLFDGPTRARLLASKPSLSPPDPLVEAFHQAGGGDFVNSLMRVDMATQLPDDLLLLTDKMTMASSLECRVPLLSNAMVDLAARLPSGMKIQGGQLKHLFKLAMRGVLPAATLQKSKRGFGAPMGAWLKKELRPLMHVVLSQESVERRGLLDPSAVREAIALHESARRDYVL